ncbi:MAG: cytochrome c maturation protein CcmE [Pseudomonadota bacterium]
MNRKGIRLMWIGVIGVVLSTAVGLSLFAFQSGISFAMSPSELREASPDPGQRVRLFGLVQQGSVERGEGLNVSFTLGDGAVTVPVTFNDILPDLFREEQGIITEGSLRPDGTFVADTVLAKHDENYMPAGMAEKLKKDGHWKGEASAGQSGAYGAKPREQSNDG